MRSLETTRATVVGLYKMLDRGSKWCIYTKNAQIAGQGAMASALCPQVQAPTAVNCGVGACMHAI